MARGDFFADVRNAISFMAPRVESDRPFTDTNYIQRMLSGSDQWISPQVVEAFDPADFADLDEGLRDDLTRAVGEFRQVAATVNPGELVASERRDAALLPFTRIVTIAQGLVRDDWMAASTALLAEAEGWAREEGWPTRRYPKAVTEDFIGKYSLDRLVYSADGSQLALIPLGRFAPGTEGMFDLAVMPAYDSMMVVREQGRWLVHPLPGDEDRRYDWSKETFISQSHALASLP